MSGAWGNIKKFFTSVPGVLKSYWGIGRADGGPVTRSVGGPIGLASGGYGKVVGPGTTTSDSIPALLSDQEYVIRAWAAKRIGMSNLDVMNATGRIPSRLASGSSTTSRTGGEQSITNSGDIIIPVYIGSTKLEELVVTARQRADYRSGGR